MNKFVINLSGIETDYSKKHCAIRRPEKLQLVQMRAIKENLSDPLMMNSIGIFIILIRHENLS